MTASEATSSAAGLFRRSSDVDETRVGDRVVLYHVQDGGAFVLNPTASLLWGRLATPCAIGDLAAQLRRAFPTLPEQRAIADAQTCMTELQGSGLVVAGA
ncbi:MAG: PqqD family protein [Gemmatimonadota bacterium]|nr:PqqD family protein [Gemmatimonadota bacterium]